MCNPACIKFAETRLKREDVAGKSVLEVGSANINGSLRPSVEAFGPSKYIGVDLKAAPGVDEVCNVYDLVQRFGPETFEVLISTELIEHVRDWRSVLSNFKKILKKGGILLLTTRSVGFPYHGFPLDYWRYEEEDMRHIFSDFRIEFLEKDSISPGVFLKATKPFDFCEKDLSHYALYSMVAKKRARAIGNLQNLTFLMAHRWAGWARRM